MEREEVEIYRNKLAERQLAIKEAGLPVIVVLEGWGASGKGSLLGNLVQYMDPRFYDAYNMDVASPDELRRPLLYRYALRIPENGKFSFYDGSWMTAITNQLLHKTVDKDEYQRMVGEAKDFERQLADNGYLVIKFFLDISAKEQKRRMKRLADNKDTAWQVTQDDRWQNDHYKKCKKLYEEYMRETDTKLCPWHVITADNKADVERFVANTIIASIDEAIKNPHTAKIIENKFELRETIPLKEISLSDKTISIEDYRKRRKALQKELKALQNKLYCQKIPVIVAYEGWDAAGKGGNIKRLTSPMDPRSCHVFPIASPSKEEKNRHFLWRFFNRLPKTGHIAIFDRTWYGRVMVERLEGFCSENDWQRAFNEMNEFEQLLTDWGAIVIKFWVQIDKDTQLERFTMRQNTPEKQWKITDEDWRNREKWDLYEGAIDEMIKKTNTTFAPWYVLESNDKKYARVKALEILVNAIKERLGEK